MSASSVKVALAPPAGYHWYISSSQYEGSRFSLGLWPLGLVPDETGLAKGKNGRWFSTSDKEQFNHRRQIHRASKRILRRRTKRMAREQYESSILGEVEAA